MTRTTSAAGIAHDLARDRARRIADVRYSLDCRIANHARVLHCRQEIRFRFESPRGDGELLLDWRPQCSREALERAAGTLVINGRRAPRTIHRAGHLQVPHRTLADANCIELEWQAPMRAAGSALTRYRDSTDGAVYVYSLFVPADASTVFPCFDQPDLKARFSLALTMPEHWNAIANAPIARTARRGRMRELTFAESEPISTYAFAFAAGPFVAIDDSATGDTTRLWVRRSQRRRARKQARDILRLNGAAVRYCARYFDHGFPFRKYDLVLIPQFPYRGMEHAGATFLDESAALLPGSPGAAELFQRAQLVFHETAHQWMGDLVTMRWFDDLWIKEGFANFIAYKLAERVVSRKHAELFFHDLKVAALDVDGTPGAAAVHRPLADLKQAKAQYDVIVYAKAPAVLRMLEHHLGADSFRRGVRTLVRSHAFGTVDWRELITAFEAASGRVLQRWAKVWLLRAGARSVRRHDECIGSHVYALPAPSRAGTARAKRAIVRSRDALRRYCVWEYLWAAVGNCMLHPIRFAELVLSHGAAEPAAVTVGRLALRLTRLIDRLLDDAEQRHIGSQLESLAASRVHASAELRLAWTRALIALSRTGRGYAMLETLVVDRRRPLTGGERLKAIAALIAGGRMSVFQGVQALGPDAQSKERRLAVHCLQAASPQPEDKRRLFRRWLDDPSLPDYWIDAALPWFNHPAHAALTLGFLAQALEALPMLAATRKIFFINRWLDAFIAGQRSGEALRVIRRYVARRTLEPHWRRKVLESAHALERDLAVYRRWHA